MLVINIRICDHEFTFQINTDSSADSTQAQAANRRSRAWTPLPQVGARIGADSQSHNTIQCAPVCVEHVWDWPNDIYFGRRGTAEPRGQRMFR